MTSSSLQQMAKAYLAAMRGLDEPKDAFSDVLEACDDLTKGIEVTLALIAEARNEGELAYVAAGPLEDILKLHGTRAIPALEAAAETSPNVRKALSGVYLSEHHEAFSEWRRLVDQYGT
jgi:hypothetical protein